MPPELAIYSSGQGVPAAAPKSRDIEFGSRRAQLPPELAL